MSHGVILITRFWKGSWSWLTWGSVTHRWFA